jgi:hypothetical protein
VGNAALFFYLAMGVIIDTKAVIIIKVDADK